MMQLKTERALKTADKHIYKFYNTNFIKTAHSKQH